MSGSILIPHLSQKFTYGSFVDSYGTSNDGYFNKAAEIIDFWASDKQEFKIRTSGSTGSPKTIELDKSLMIRSAQNTIAYFQLGKQSQLVLALNPKYIGGMMLIVRAIVLKSDLVILPVEGNPLEFATSPIPGDFIALSPLQVEKILASEFQFNMLHKLNNIIIGGAPVSQKLSNTIQQISIPCYHTYGMTETCSHIALKRLNGNRPEQFYKLLPGYKIHLNENGCLVIVINGKEFITNDQVNIINHQEFEWLGRSDWVINSGGVKINPEIIETAIQKYSLESGLDFRLVVTGIEDKTLGQKVVLVIEGDHWEENRTNEFIEKLKEILPKYSSPKEIIFLEEIPINESGKPDRNELLKLI